MVPLNPEHTMRVGTVIFSLPCPETRIPRATLPSQPRPARVPSTSQFAFPCTKYGMKNKRYCVLCRKPCTILRSSHLPGPCLFVRTLSHLHVNLTSFHTIEHVRRSSNHLRPPKQHNKTTMLGIIPCNLIMVVARSSTEVFTRSNHPEAGH